MMKRNNNKCRKVWTDHKGPVPKDNDGRSYEVHHIDGDPSNNKISNLVCVSIEEHYHIHHSQGDWGACALILKRMGRSVQEISELTSRHNKKMVEDGTHPFLKRSDGTSIGSEVARREVKNGTHNFIGSPYAKKMYEDGTHPFLGGSIQTESNHRRIQDGSHNLLGKNNPTHGRIKNGTYHLLGPAANINLLKNGTHASQLKISCLFCKKELDKANFGRSHGDKCKLRSPSLHGND